MCVPSVSLWEISVLRKLDQEVGNVSDSFEMSTIIRIGDLVVFQEIVILFWIFYPGVGKKLGIF